MKKWCCYYKDKKRTWSMDIDEAITYKSLNFNLVTIGKFN